MSIVSTVRFPRTPLVHLLAVAVASVASYASAEPAVAEAPAAAPAKTLALASIFADHMVLQRDMKLPVWGHAKPGAKVTVKFEVDEQQATADADGKWKAVIGPFDAGGPYELTVAAGDDTLTLNDVLVGEVWVASGQSNMEWPMTHVREAEKEIAAADRPQIRFIDVPNVTADKPLDSFETKGWQAVKPENIGGFSAVAYFFACDLHKQLDVPIGMIGCSWGGTPMEAWTSREALASSSTFMQIIEAQDQPPATPEEAEARKQGAHNQPSALFNGMLSAVIPYGIRGAIWYQGEGNAGRHNQYAELSKLMIADWRNRWGEGEFPFLLVQLAAFEPGGDSWPYLREAQAQTMDLPNTGMAVAIDIGEKTDIHPKNKQDVGARLALAARAVAYGEAIEHSGPTYREMKADGKDVRLSFDHAEGLTAKGDELKGFQVAGDDGKFVPATAKIDGKLVVVSSDAVPAPKEVRYNWAAFPDGNLYNAAGLPAVPFRTDKIKGPGAP